MNRGRLALLILLLAILAAGFWSYRGVTDSLREIRAASLTALLDTQVEALDVWITEQQHDAEQSAADARLRRQVATLLEIGRGGDAQRLRRASARQALLDLLLRPDSSAVAAHVIDPQGRVVASRHDDYTGRRLTPQAMQLVAPVLRGQTRFVYPHRETESILEPESVAFDRPLVWIETPIKGDDGGIVAALGLGYFANQRFADILKAARPGKSGETYAFDGAGVMLTESRYLKEAAALGLLEAGAQGSAIGALHVREPPLAPEADLPGEASALSSLSPPSPLGRPLTRLAARAIGARFEPQPQGRSGVLLDPYRNYLGREVIGAWRWLARYDMGIALELDAGEAYAPLRYLDVGVAAVLTLMTLVWFSAFVPPAALLGRLRERAGLRSVGPYRLLRQIGEGAISTVYLARHRLLQRPVAVKLLKPQSTTDEWTARFRREVQLASELRHPNTIAIYDYGEAPGGILYYAMEYLEGLSLADLVERYGPQPAPRAAYLLRQVCASLAEAHGRGLVHRDIKPQNIMACRMSGQGDVAKVLDFGLVKRIDTTDTRDLTGSLHILGTPLYMAPERLRDPGAADARSDVYSLGAVGFHLLTGRRLFETGSDHDLTYRILHAPPPRAAEYAPGPVPPDLDDLLARCLAKEPANRPQSVTEVADLLDRVLAANPWTQRQIDAWWRRHWVDAAHPERRIVAQ